MCLYPRLIENRKYKSNQKNGGVIPAIIDKRTLMVPVGCGQCMECRKKRSRDWQVRISEEVRSQELKGYFVTLTYSTESIKKLLEKETAEGYELDYILAKKGMRRFLERWRKKHKKSVKHWFVTELGQKNEEHLHLHGFIWTDKEPEEINNTWSYGNVWIGDYVIERTVNYTVNYISKIEEKH